MKIDSEHLEVVDSYINHLYPIRRRKKWIKRYNRAYMATYNAYCFRYKGSYADESVRGNRRIIQQMRAVYLQGR